ncbi:MAG TPA: thymidylate synthase, partial [Clostridiales bacterium]|nr:thymidylate synthase [Clostridiales bacterium]
VSGLEPGEFVHVIADAHIYDRHVDMIKEVIAKEPLPAPRLIMDKSIQNFYDFTVDSFSLEGYEYHKLGKKIPVAV